MKKNSKNKLKQVCMFVEKLGKKLVSLSSFFLSFFTRGFARCLKDDAHNSHFQGSHFRARISNTRDDHDRQLQNKYLHPNDTRFRARISNTRADHFWQPENKSLHPKDIRFRARISNT